MGEPEGTAEAAGEWAESGWGRWGEVKWVERNGRRSDEDGRRLVGLRWRGKNWQRGR